MAEPAETADPKAPPPEATALEGEDAASLVGIMYSERKWIVPGWMKAAFFWVALTGVAGLGVQAGFKRAEFMRLLIDGVVEPEPFGNKPAPVIVLPKGQGGPEVDLAQFRGQWVFVNYWATWCAPCRDEMPSMEMLNRRLVKDGRPVQMVAISVDEDWAEVNRFFGATAPSFTVLWDREKKTALAFGTRKFPESYLIDPEGRVAAKFTGPRDWYNQATVQYFDEIVAGRRKPS